MRIRFRGIVFFTIIFLFTIVQTRHLSAGNTVNMTVDKKTGDIRWSFDAIKATTNIRWQIKGYYLSYKPCSKQNFGYPTRENRDMISLYTDNNTLKVVSKKPGQSPGSVKTDVKLDGNYIKGRMMQNKKFHEGLIKNYKKGNKKLYLDTIFETYLVINDPTIRAKVIAAYKKKPKNNFGTKESKYVYVGGHKYEYSESQNAVRLIRKNDLINIDMIRAAEPWSAAAQKQWYSTNYYNHPITYEIESNVIVEYVDTSGNLIGDVVDSLKINKKTVAKIKNDKKTLFNPYYNFRKDGVDKRLIKNNKYAHFCDDITINLPEKITVKKGKEVLKYELIKSYCQNLKKTSKKNIKNGKEATKQKLILGLNDKIVVGRYKLAGGPPEEEEEETIENELPAPNPRGKIAAGTLERSDFDVEAGIPVTEFYYKNVIAEGYLIKYRFKRIKGKKKFTVKSEVSVKPENKKIKHETAILREYSYWVIDNLEVYTIDSAVLNNGAIPDTGERILPNSNVKNPVKYRINKNHIIPPKGANSVINLGKIKEGKDFDPSKKIDSKIGDIVVKNDFLEIDGVVIMDDVESKSKTPTPQRPEEVGKDIGEDIDERVLYSFGKTIQRETANEYYDSSGFVTYKMTDSVNPEGAESIDFEIDYVNPVVVHTPVVCDYKIRDAKHWCQLVKPDETRYQLVLDKDFELDIITIGNHRDIKGYGYKDYAKYVQRKEVIFPFDVIYEGRLYSESTPIIIRSNTKFEVPITVKEGLYDIIVRSVAINFLEGRNPFGENYANLSLENYIAENKIPVEVSGRLIDFTLTKIKNSSLWEDVFNNEYGGGVHLNNLPLITGDNPRYGNEGKFKKGYAVEFAVTTVGGYYNEPYGVEMNFSFSILDEKTGKRQPVDVYYEAISESTGESLGLVKLGSERDKSNIHFIEMGNSRIGLFTYDRELLPKQLLSIGSNEYIQRWRGEYALPERIYVCEKGLNLKSYLNSNMALYFDEDIWIKKGNLTISAEIFALKDGEKRLSYINFENSLKGYFNNWAYETSDRRKFSDKGNLVKFKDGDLFVYDLLKYIWQERRSELRKIY